MIHAANRLGISYREKAKSFSPLKSPIVDVHTHINGGQAAKLYSEVTKLYGVGFTLSMTRFEEVEAVKQVLKERVHFIAIPEFQGADILHSHGKGYVERIKAFHAGGSRIAKFFAAPRLLGQGWGLGDAKVLHLNSPLRMEAMKVAQDLGMMFMTHVGDPDTWFKTKYSDIKHYGTKVSQYEQLEEVLDRFRVPWIGAHMGGFPEDLNFLSGLLERHSNLHLDTSATKWMVRELSRHSREELLKFLTKFSDRILFGSDIVTSDTHLSGENEKRDEAFDLYASRYFALRSLFESDYDGESPIADPDLHLIAPDKFTEMDAPKLVGKKLPKEVLEKLYFGSSTKLLTPYLK